MKVANMFAVTLSLTELQPGSRYYLSIFEAEPLLLLISAPPCFVLQL